MRAELIVVAAMALVLCGCASQMVEEREAQSAPAADYRMAVKTALMEDGQIPVAPVRVEYGDNGIRLTGFVANEAERQRAGEVARQAVPDLRVDNALEVWTPPGNR